MQDREAFCRTLDSFRRDNIYTPGCLTSRIDEVLPRLILHKKGRYTTVTGLRAIAKHTNRSYEYLCSYFVKCLSCVVEKDEQSRLMIKGHLAPRDVRRFEKMYLTQKILCGYCRSPDTVLTNGQIICKNCTKSRRDIVDK